MSIRRLGKEKIRNIKTLNGEVVRTGAKEQNIS